MVRITRYSIVHDSTENGLRRLLDHLDGTPRPMAMVLYGGRLLACARLRVKDIEFGSSRIVIRRGKGAKDRVTLPPRAARESLEIHLRGVRSHNECDLRSGAGWVELRFALGRKHPDAGRE